MNSTTKVRPAYSISNSLVARYPAIIHTNSVCERSPSWPTASQGSYIERLTREAHAWAEHAAGTSSMKAGTIRRKAHESLAFSLTHRLNAFAVPTKLRGVSKQACQQAIATLHDLSMPFGTKLCMEVHEEAVIVCFGYERLGELAMKHGWARSLVPFGLTLHLLEVTGTQRTQGYLGCNVALGHAGVSALRYARHQQALTGGDGTGLPGIQPALPAPRSVLRREDTWPHDTLVVHHDLRALRSSPDHPGDVVLSRDPRGKAEANIPHIVRHSPTGIEWHSTGSGASDLAYSVLAHYAGAEVAARYCRAFKRQVIAHLPYQGARLQRRFVMAWIAREREKSAHWEETLAGMPSGDGAAGDPGHAA